MISRPREIKVHCRYLLPTKIYCITQCYLIRIDYYPFYSSFFFAFFPCLSSSCNQILRQADHHPSLFLAVHQDLTCINCRFLYTIAYAWPFDHFLGDNSDLDNFNNHTIMTESINLTSKVKLKTNPIYSNSMCLLKQKKGKLFIAQSKGIHIYDINSQKFQDIKLGKENNGILSCLTQSDDLVFFCFGMKILACGSNGKILYESDTYLAVDKIQSIHVYGYQLWLVSGNMVSEFLIGGVQLSNKQSRITPSPAREIQDTNSQIYDVKINHSLLFKLDTQKPFLLLLKHNNQIECYDKKDAAAYTTESPPTFGYIYPSEPNSNRVLVGTMSGEILYLEVQRKKIKKIWGIKDNSKGKINCIVEVKNGFIIFRDEGFQLWNQNRQFLGRENTTQKILSAFYLPSEESLFYGTNSGQLVEMYNYEKMMKLAKDRNEQSQKDKLKKQILELKKIKDQLTLKADKLGVAKQFKNGKNIKNTLNLTIDYGKLCYCLQVISERPIIKFMMKGNIKLLESGQKISFQGQQDQDNQVYMIRTDQKKSIFIRFQYAEKYHLNEKLYTTIYNDFDGYLFASNHNIDLKSLCLHQKVESKLLDKANLKANILKISGQFKYFQMTAWLSSIFNDFGSPSLETQSIQFCYESLITKNKVYLQYRDKHCAFYSQSPTPLSILKKCILQKSKEKQLSLNYDTKTSIQGVANLLKKIGPKVKSLERNKKEYELLPGLQELQNESMGSDLKEILTRGEQIKQKYQQSCREYEQLKASIVQFFVNYRLLNNKQCNTFQVEEVTRSLDNFNPEKLIKLIEAS